MSSEPSGSRGLSVPLIGISAVLLVVAIVLLVWGSSAQRTLPPPSTGHAHPTTSTAPQTVPSVPLVAVSIPVSIQIPSINVSAPLSQLGLTAYGTVQAPVSNTEPGWFNGGVTPGQMGSSVIIGHVDSYKGEAVFFNLRSLQPSSLVTVTLANGATVTFSVVSVIQYDKTAFPNGLVYGNQGYPALQLVTCGGVFDQQTGSYLSNIVVYTKLVSFTAPRA